MEFGLKSVPFGISSAYPTFGSVGEAVALAKRAGLKEGGRGGSLDGGGGGGDGDGVVIGIGSGAAMDLAKAVADSMFGTVDDTITNGSGSNDYGSSQLVLAPCTLSGLWAASSNSPSLLLDTKEEMILPHLPSSWNNSNGASSKRRVGTTVTMDATQLLALPQLYTEFIPMKRTGYSVPPSMAHVAAAALAILLDAARSVDAAAGSASSVAASGGNSSVEQLTGEMKHVAALCASVLHLAATTQQQNEVVDEEATMQAQQHLLNAIPRLSPLIEQSSLLLSRSSSASSSSMIMTTTGTIPQRLANALLPTYFPQCHIVTYLACTLPGLCEVLSPSSQTTQSSTTNISDGASNTSIVEEVAKSIMSCIGENNNISHVVTEAGIPSMASLAYGTPDMNTLIGSLDSYESLIASTIISGAGAGGQDESWIMEDVLQRSLSR